MRKLYIFLFIIFLVPLFATKQVETSSYKLFCGNSNPSLAQEVAYILGINLGKASVGRFQDGEVRIKIDENVRDKDIYILQSICSTHDASVNDNLMELFLLIRSCKRASAKKIIAVIPYFGYARQDRKMEERAPISAADIALLLETAGADQIITLDLHCGQIQGFFQKTPVDNLKTGVVFVPFFERKELKNLVVVAPDSGALPRAQNLIEGLNKYGIQARLSMLVKQRFNLKGLEKMYLIGDVKNSDVLIIDDICDTGVTLVHTANEMKTLGANKVYACVTHPVFSKNANETIKNSSLDEIIVTDTIPLKPDTSSKVVQISIAPLIAEAIKRSLNGESVSNLSDF